MASGSCQAILRKAEKRPCGITLLGWQVRVTLQLSSSMKVRFVTQITNYAEVLMVWCRLEGSKAGKVTSRDQPGTRPAGPSEEQAQLQHRPVQIVGGLGDVLVEDVEARDLNE